MAEAVHNTQQEFWQPPAPMGQQLAAGEQPLPVLQEACRHCGSEFMIAARFCHACGAKRPAEANKKSDAVAFAGLWAEQVEWAKSTVRSWSRNIPFPNWLRYLHFHEIKRWVGLPTASLIAFIIGLGCVGGMLGVSLFFRASNLAEFQAIQMWRIEWLLGATASFVAALLLKKTSKE
jgi:hypothetical protein